MPIRQQLAADFGKKRRDADFWIHCLLYASLLAAFWPITLWFAGTAHEQSRILHALLALGMATVFLIRFGGAQMGEMLEFNRSAKRSLSAAYILLTLSVLTRQFLPDGTHTHLLHVVSLINIPAYCLGITSLVFFVFGEQIRRIAYTVSGTFCTFLLLSTLLNPLDWPLRTLAGKWAGFVLNLLGKSVELGLVKGESGVPNLILLVENHPFHVASECNGFGVILTSILLSVMLAFYRRLNAFDCTINALVGIAIGFSFNIVRISIIILLAPQMMSHYMIMHEIVGGVTYWGCLIVVWLILNGPVREETKPHSNSTATG